MPCSLPMAALLSLIPKGYSSPGYDQILKEYSGADGVCVAFRDEDDIVILSTVDKQAA